MSIGIRGGEGEPLANHPIAKSMLGAGGLAPGMAKEVTRYRGEGSNLQNDGQKLDAASSNGLGSEENRFSLEPTSSVSPLVYLESIPGKGLTLKPQPASKTSPIIDKKA